jgi:sulfatase maturation enzyme AslB (radical SAM superfamily)
MQSTVLNALSLKIGWALQWRKGVAAFDRKSGRSRLGGPLKLHLQTIDVCNGRCIVCPYPSKAASKTSRNTMSDTLLEEVCRQFSRPGTMDSCLLMLQNEPFLDSRFAERVSTIKRRLGTRTTVCAVTNGTAVTEKNATALRDAGLDHIYVSVDSVSERTFHKIRPGHDLRRVEQGAKILLRTFDRGRVTVKLLQQRDNAGEERAFERYWKSRGARVKFSKLTNRAGELGGFDGLRTGKPDLLRRAIAPWLNRLIPCCPLPFSAACVLWDGRTILCCHDWGPKETFGRVGTAPLADLWNGAAINHHRRLLIEKRADESSVCRDCSLAGAFWGA